MITRVVLGGASDPQLAAVARTMARALAARQAALLVVPSASRLVDEGATAVRFLPDERARVCLGLQLALEEAFGDLATASVVLLCRDGALESAVDLPAGDWRDLLARRRLNAVELRDGRYLAVSLLGGDDSPRARAWLGHPHLRVATDPEAAARQLLHALGVPEPVEIERKLLVRALPTDWPVPFVDVEIEQTYLVAPPMVAERVRRRGEGGVFVCTHTVKRNTEDGRREEIERSISCDEHDELLGRADAARRPVRKRRRCFLWRGRYFELDLFDSPRPGLVLMEVELEQPDEQVELPPFIDVEREVTGDPAYSNHALAMSPG